MIAPKTDLDHVGADSTQSFLLDIEDTYESESFSNEFRLDRVDGLVGPVPGHSGGAVQLSEHGPPVG